MRNLLNQSEMAAPTSLLEARAELAVAIHAWAETGNPLNPHPAPLAAIAEAQARIDRPEVAVEAAEGRETRQRGVLMSHTQLRLAISGLEALMAMADPEQYQGIEDAANVLRDGLGEAPVKMFERDEENAA